MQRPFVVLTLSLAVVSAACGSQESSEVASAKVTYRSAAAAVSADARAERGECLPIPGSGGHCSAPASLIHKTCMDEQRMIHAEVSLVRAEGHTMSDEFPPCASIGDK